MMEQENKNLQRKEDTKKEIESLKEQLLREQEEKKYLAEAIEGKDSQINSMSVELEKALKREAEFKNSEKFLKEMQNALEFKQKELERRVKELNLVLNAYNSFAKMMQGAVENNSILLEKTLEDIQRKGE